MDRRLSIVLVEDDEDSREILQLFLKERGHDVFAASDGAQGITAIVQRRPHLALVDLSLPLLNGLDVARLVRSEQEGRSVYLVALTGHGRHADRVAAMGAGFDEYILKPLRPGEIDRLIDRAVRPRRDAGPMPLPCRE